MGVMGVLIVVICSFILIVFGLVLLRVKTGNKFEIKNSDILLALIPIFLWLFITGKIERIRVAEVEIVRAFREASQSAIAPEVTSLNGLPVEAVRAVPRGGTGEIPRLVAMRAEALVFRLGHGEYSGPVINKYLTDLTKYPFLRYIVIADPSEKLVGIADARKLASIFQGPTYPYSPQDFAEWINSSDIKAIKQLPDFVGVEDAINKTTNKRVALEQMESLNVETLPVIDEEGRFVGIVDRTRLAASLIIDVARQIE